MTLFARNPPDSRHSFAHSTEVALGCLRGEHDGTLRTIALNGVYRTLKAYEAHGFVGYEQPDGENLRRFIEETLASVSDDRAPREVIEAVCSVLAHLCGFALASDAALKLAEAFFERVISRAEQLNAPILVIGESECVAEDVASNEATALADELRTARLRIERFEAARDAISADVIEDFLAQKFVQRADERQKAMGLRYTKAETSDLAKEIAKFVNGLFAREGC